MLQHVSHFVGETDWKVIAIDVTDPLASELNGRCIFIITNLMCYFAHIEISVVFLK